MVKTIRQPRYAGLKGLRGAGDITSGSILDTGFGTSVDCSKTAQFVLNPGCWGRSVSAWEQMAQFAASAASLPIPGAPPAVPLAFSGQETYAGSAPDVLNQFDQETTDVLRQAKASYSADLQAWADSTVPVDDSAPGFWDQWKYWIIGGSAAAGLFLLATQRR